MKKIYNWEAYTEIHKKMFGATPSVRGITALGSYKGMVRNIEINYYNELEPMMKKLNALIMPYYEDITANMSKLLGLTPKGLKVAQERLLKDHGTLEVWKKKGE